MNISQSNGVRHQILGIESAPHLKAPMTTEKIMGLVLLCLVPAFLVEIYFFGFGVLWQFVNCALTATICEIVVALLRHKSVKCTLKEMSYLVTALILAMTLPPLLPVYFSVVATIFAIIIAKSVFGGLGNNIFNPAMVGFVFIIISSPQMMYETWIKPAPEAYSVASLTNTYDVIYNGAKPNELKLEISKLIPSEDINTNQNTNNTNKQNPDGTTGATVADGTTGATSSDNTTGATKIADAIDAFTGATFLEAIKADRKNGDLQKVKGHDFTDSEYQAYLYLGAAFILGGLVLLIFKIIFFKMVLAFFITFIGLSYVMNTLMPGYFLPPIDNLLFGGTLIAAFFIITDPVTASGTAHGRIYFAILFAILLVFLRAFGSYSDAVAFAVLLSNACAPLIDVLAHRRPYGVGYKKGGMR